MPDKHGWDSGELLEIYKVAVEEYRFQVSLNWARTRYLLVLNGAILAVGSGLLEVEREQQAWLIGAIFVLGALTSLHAAAVTAKQHSYYRNARDRMNIIGRGIGLPDNYLLATTPGMAHDATRTFWSKLSRITWMHYLLFGFLALMHALGAGYVLLM